MTQSKRKSENPRELDAIELLTEDHRKVKKLFKDFQKLKKEGGSYSHKSKLVEQICEALSIHAQVEEEIFYPAARAAINAPDLMDEADVEHAGAKDLIGQLQGMKPHDSHYDAMVKVLGEEILHHVKEEEGKIFPKVRKATLDTKALGVKIATRVHELKDDMLTPAKPNENMSRFNKDATESAALR